MQNVNYHITKVEKDKNANTAVLNQIHINEIAVLNQIHINEILDLVRREASMTERYGSIDRLEILDDIIQTFNYELRGE